jgi:hypothetical protein
MIASRTLRIGAAALLALTGACSSDSTGPGAPAASLEQVFSEASLSSLSAFTGSFTPVPASLTTLPPPSTCEPAGGGYFCPTVTISGVMVNRKFIMYDAQGVVQPQFISGTTEKVRFESTGHGDVTSGTNSYTVDQAQTLVLSGLTTSTHYLNGTSAWSVTQRPATGVTVTTAVVTFNNLELPKESGGYPGSGSMDLTLTSTPVSARMLQAHLAFNGTSKVAVTGNIGGLPLPPCTLDLAAQPPSCPFGS